ncbi:hypothetical protein Pelo_10225 [Pelomyxa schiedti]|nr:hypothetical protein Pelo_10225 [Pelomyxa schiedti]
MYSHVLFFTSLFLVLVDMLELMYMYIIERQFVISKFLEWLFWVLVCLPGSLLRQLNNPGLLLFCAVWYWLLRNHNNVAVPVALFGKERHVLSQYVFVVEPVSWLEKCTGKAGSNPLQNTNLAIDRLIVRKAVALMYRNIALPQC